MTAKEFHHRRYMMASPITNLQDLTEGPSDDHSEIMRVQWQVHLNFLVVLTAA